MKANFEVVFSLKLLESVIYPRTIEQLIFIEEDGKLYYTGSGGGGGYAPDFTRAKVTSKSADVFEIEVPMVTPADDEGKIFAYKAVQQNGNWVLDNYYYVSDSFFYD